LNAVQVYRVGRWAYTRGIPLIPSVCKALNYFLFNCFVTAKSDIGEGVVLGYGGMGVVIHTAARIGRNSFIGQQVTIGSKASFFSDEPQADVPVIGEDVFIGAGAKVLGGITIGDGAVVGANAVVIQDVPGCGVVAGNPAKLIRVRSEVRSPIPASRRAR
jgi:serine O-acetyltransferase